MPRPVRMAPKGSPQRLIILASLAFLVGSTIVVFGKFYAARNSAPDRLQGTSNRREVVLLQQAEGYELVLKREPNNRAALEGLATTRLALNDPQGAIAPLEKLVTLNPDRADYSTKLAKARQQAGDRPPP